MTVLELEMEDPLQSLEVNIKTTLKEDENELTPQRTEHTQCFDKSLCLRTRRLSFTGPEGVQRPKVLLRRPASMYTMSVTKARPAAVLLRPHQHAVAKCIARTKSHSRMAKLDTTIRPVIPSTPRLVPCRLAPKMRLPKMAMLWAFLDRIEHIAVNDVYTTTSDDDSRGTVNYVLDVHCYRERQGLPTQRFQPTTASARQPPPKRQPDFQVHHRYSSFRTLQRRVHKAATSKHVQVSHPYINRTPRQSSHRQCIYCHRLNQLVAPRSSALLGWKTKFLTTIEMRKILLSQFVLELVLLTRMQRHTCSNLEMLRILYQPSNAYVERSVPGLLRRFLTVQTGETFMRH